MAGADEPLWITQLSDRDLVAKLRESGCKVSPCTASTRGTLERRLATAVAATGSDDDTEDGSQSDKGQLKEGGEPPEVDPIQICSSSVLHTVSVDELIAFVRLHAFVNERFKPCSHGFISENGFKEPNFAAATVKAFTGCSWTVLYGTFKRLSWAESTTMQLHINDASDSNTVIGRLSEMMATQTDAELEEAIPGVLDHMEGFRVQRKLRKNLTGALGPSVPVSCIRFILSFVDGECAKDGSQMVVQTAHTDGNGSHAGLHVCSAGDASCTVEYVTLGGLRARVCGSTAGAPSYYANRAWHGREPWPGVPLPSGERMQHRVVLSSAGRIRIAMLVDVDATPDLKVYDAYIKSLGCKQHEWTDAAVRALRDAAETSR
eukprot:m.413416 g.413416  ORF g.413416 m.413416 type:complete len:376 (-) comp29091_c0_seq1:612-1739(-)